jgi:hypothetical protein
MSLTKPIPKKLRDEMDADPFYHKCCVTGVKSGAQFKIDWHHNFRWQGTRLNEKWCILPVWKKVHDKADTREVRDFLDWIMLNRADEETLQRYSKAENLIAKRDRLNKVYANKENHPVI